MVYKLLHIFNFNSTHIHTSTHTHKTNVWITQYNTKSRQGSANTSQEWSTPTTIQINLLPLNPTLPPCRLILNFICGVKIYHYFLSRVPNKYCNCAYNNVISQGILAGFSDVLSNLYICLCTDLNRHSYSTQLVLFICSLGASLVSACITMSGMD